MDEADLPPIAIVSGGSSGIGFATVDAFLRAGYRVAFFSQQADRVGAAAQALATSYGEQRIWPATVDLRDIVAIRSFAAELIERWGTPSVLVCNAGYSPKRQGGRVSLAGIDLAEWNEVLAVNLTGALVCCQCVLPAMAERRYGRIVLIGSLAGRTTPRIAGAAYAASKSGLASLARSIVSEYSQFGVTANTITPGRILTDMTGPPDTATNQETLRRIPIGRLGRPEDIARVAVFLAAPEADFVNGAVFDVNGGEFVAP